MRYDMLKEHITDMMSQVLLPYMAVSRFVLYGKAGHNTKVSKLYVCVYICRVSSWEASEAAISR